VHGEVNSRCICSRDEGLWQVVHNLATNSTFCHQLQLSIAVPAFICPSPGKTSELGSTPLRIGKGMSFRHWLGHPNWWYSKLLLQSIVFQPSHKSHLSNVTSIKRTIPFQISTLPIQRPCHIHFIGQENISSIPLETLLLSVSRAISLRSRMPESFCLDAAIREMSFIQYFANRRVVRGFAVWQFLN
jgi:hypothetical protein